MPIGKGWLFRRGERPVSVDAIELEDYEEYMDVEKDLIIMPDIWEFDDEDYIEIESDDFYDDEYYLSGDGPNAMEFDSDVCYTDIDQLCKEVGLSS